MKNSICFVILFSLTLITSPMTGCGGNEDNTGKTADEKTLSQAAVEQNADLPATDDTNGTQKKMPEIVTQMQPGFPEIKPSQPVQGGAAVSMETESSGSIESPSAAQEVPDVIVIENQGYSTNKKGPVKFSHMKHNKEYNVSCIQCHHVYKNGGNIWKEGDPVEKCIACHDPVEERDKAMKLQNAFHKNCKDCHNEATKEGKEAPSTKCAGCHES